ncbi:MAG: IclR family transcriptional regulator [Alicyclobacillus macrosporangiidus]|uniref:IclR family transcriptional regulator n=1 Tax=Alicyclobacillus macrosporangiidus TaxID=392015 RepID=UPI0026F1A025|nr:IclR family transcriptional regulator [Alicyclobacillus macrosporangiidus]MCL6597480.1 IclR family transcriptional regulator [Alicyclobacillus macrosporangiidus]
MDNPKYYAPSVDIAARILKFLSRYRHKKSTLSEISIALELNKSTCLRVLKTLENHHLVQYDVESRKYSLGIYNVILGYRTQENLDYLAIITPFLREAAARTELTVVFVQRISEDRMMYVAKHESLAPVRVNVSVGNQFPITQVSYGQWLLAYAEKPERDRFIKNGLPRLTTYTITNEVRYLERLEDIRKEGVLVSREEYVPGVVAISSPIFSHPNVILGVFALLGMASALTEGQIESYRQIVKDVSKRCNMLTMTGNVTIDNSF